MASCTGGSPISSRPTWGHSDSTISAASATPAGPACNPHPRLPVTSFQTYLLGFVILVLGLAAAAYMLGVPQVWIGIGAIILLGIGIITASQRPGGPGGPSGRGGPGGPGGLGGPYR